MTALTKFARKYGPKTLICLLAVTHGLPLGARVFSEATAVFDPNVDGNVIVIGRDDSWRLQRLTERTDAMLATFLSLRERLKSEDAQLEFEASVQSLPGRSRSWRFDNLGLRPDAALDRRDVTEAIELLNAKRDLLRHTALAAKAYSEALAAKDGERMTDAGQKLSRAIHLIAEQYPELVSKPIEYGSSERYRAEKAIEGDWTILDRLFLHPPAGFDRIVTAERLDIPKIGRP